MVKPTGGCDSPSVRVAANVRSLRNERGWSLRELSEHVSAVGGSITLASMSRLELCERSVDVDELMELALALGVTPLRLMLTSTADPDRNSTLSPNVVVKQADAWIWATGMLPLEPMITEGGGIDTDAIIRWEEENAPHIEHEDIAISDLEEYLGVLGPLSKAITDAIGAGVPIASLRAWSELSAKLYARYQNGQTNG